MRSYRPLRATTEIRRRSPLLFVDTLFPFPLRTSPHFRPDSFLSSNSFTPNRSHSRLAPRPQAVSVSTCCIIVSFLRRAALLARRLFEYGCPRCHCHHQQQQQQTTIPPTPPYNHYRYHITFVSILRYYCTSYHFIYFLFVISVSLFDHLQTLIFFSDLFSNLLYYFYLLLTFISQFNILWFLYSAPAWNIDSTMIFAVNHRDLLRY